MARKVFIAATGMNCGKTTTSLSLMHRARKKYSRVGFVKPIGPKSIVYNGQIADKDAVLMARYFNKLDDLHLMSPLVLKQGDTRRILEGEIDRELLIRQMFDAIAELDAKNDFLIIEGAGHTGVGSVLGCNNARIARETDSTVLMVTGGGLGNVVDNAQMNMALFQKERARVNAILVNKIIPAKREQTLKYLDIAFAADQIKVIGGFNYQPILANPTMRRIANLLDVELRATEEEAQRIVHTVQIGAASAQRVVEILEDSTLIVVNVSRDELLVTLANLYQLAEYRKKIAGIVIPGLGKISTITHKILVSSGVPYMLAGRTSSTVFEMIRDDVSKLTVQDTHKIDLITELADEQLDFDTIDALLD